MVRVLYSAVDIAKYVVTRCIEKQNPISNLKLQKMLYFIWIDFYKKTSEELFFDEFCAWQFGPVVPDAYYEFCHYAGRPIFTAYYEVVLESRDEKLIDGIIDSYISVPVSVLVSKSNRIGGAWDAIYRNGVGDREIIPFRLIKEKECV